MNHKFKAELPQESPGSLWSLRIRTLIPNIAERPHPQPCSKPQSFLGSSHSTFHADVWSSQSSLLQEQLWKAPKWPLLVQFNSEEPVWGLPGSLDSVLCWSCAHLTEAAGFLQSCIS